MKEFLEIIFRRKRLFIIPFIVIFLIPSVYSFFFLRSYEANALLWVDSDTELTRLALDEQGANINPADKYLQTLTQLLQSRNFISQVVKRTDLGRNISSSRDLDNIVERVRKNIGAISIGPNSIKIVYYDRNPFLARKVVESVVNEFIAWNTQFIQKENNATINFFERQLEVTRKKWEDARRALQEYKEKHPETELLEERKLSLTPIKTGASPKVKLEFDSLQKEYEYSTKLLETALDDLAQAKVAAEVKLQKQRQLIRVIDSPKVPTKFSRKKLLLPITVSFFLALAFGLGLVTFVEWMDQSIKTEEEARKVLNLPVLATIPKVTEEHLEGD